MDDFQIRISPEFKQIYISKYNPNFSKNYHFKRIGRDNAEWKKLDNLLNNEMTFKCFKHKNYEVVLIGYKSDIAGCILYDRYYVVDEGRVCEIKYYVKIEERKGGN